MPPGPRATGRRTAIPVFDKAIEVRADPFRVLEALGATPAPGARFLHVTDALGHRWESTAVVEEAEPGRRVAFRQLAGDYAALRGRYEVEPSEGGARVRVRLELDLPFVLPRVTTEEEIRRAWSQRLDAVLLGLKRRLEH